MGRCIAKLNDLYFQWSSVVDAPKTYGLTRDELKQYFIEEAAERAGNDFDEMADKAEANQTSWSNYTIANLVEGNRIGEWGDNPNVTTEAELYDYLKNGG